MSIESLITSGLQRDESGVWVLDGHSDFGYSDGRRSERYLSKVFSEVEDLGSGSEGLEARISDWISEYHLSRKRAQLLSGFSFDRSSSVLEVGCGCGAISRFLGETFNSVISVEGSIHRARLARMRTRDLSNLQVVCAPFQSLAFKKKFDVIVCVGVYEYSASFIEADDPYEAALAYFRSLLSEDGVLIIAIENQFGLKYFNGCREDHVGRKYEGIEGYRRQSKAVRTFGKHEFKTILARHFSKAAYYYPYPDYKMPVCVLSEEFVSSENSGEIVSQIKSKDYAGPSEFVWDSSLVNLELARNGMLPFFADSFLYVVGNGSLDRARFPHLGVLYSADRVGMFAARSRIVRDSAGSMRVFKVAEFGEVLSGEVRLRNCESKWIEGLSLQSMVALASRRNDVSLSEVFAPCEKWLTHISSAAVVRNGRRYVDGSLIDCTWSNCYLKDSRCDVIDGEWEWESELPLNVLLVRAIYYSLAGLYDVDGVVRSLRASNTRRLMVKVAEVLGVRLEARDFREFVALESRFQSLVFGVSQRRHAVFLGWYLRNRALLWRARRGVAAWRRIRRGVLMRIGRDG